MRSEARCIVVALAALAAAGCGNRMIHEKSLVDDPAIRADQGEFIDALRTTYTVTNHDALHGLFLLADSEDLFDSYEDRVATAKERGWLDARWSHPANESARIGDIARAVCVITNIRGGLTMGMIGPAPRYATRELIYLEMIPERGDQQSIRGLEYLELMLLANDRLDAGRRPASVEERLQKYSEPGGTVPVDELGPAPAVEPLPGNPEPGGPEDPAQNPPRD
ncbi:MAG: hypothetical protein IBJ10_00805 [Phycisphaerales bacterium]|nr:hypothetical protein [Phycisphaerales bacterium]